MAPKITSPANVRGDLTASFGPTTIVFRDGVADVDDLSPALEAYLYGAGYGIDGKTIGQPAPEAVDSRDVAGPGDDLIGTSLRDAAVDPRPTDFLPPVNAGEHDPHGPLVVSPEIHAAEGAVLAGPVGDLVSTDAGPRVVDDAQHSAQEARESAEAEAVLIGDAHRNADADVDGDRGPLLLSDPGSVPADGDTSGPVEVETSTDTDGPAAEVVDADGEKIEPGPDGLVTLTEKGPEVADLPAGTVVNPSTDGLEQFVAPERPKQSDPIAAHREWADRVEPGVDHTEASKADIAKLGK